MNEAAIKKFATGSLRNAINTTKLFIEMLENSSKEEALELMRFTLKQSEEMLSEIEEETLDPLIMDGKLFDA